MNDNHNSHFFDGFILGIFIGALGVFLLGTKSGKNLLKILSEQGIDGLKDLVDEYSDESMEEEFEEESPQVIEKLKNEEVEHKASTETNHTNGVKEVVSKKRFFKRK